MLVNALFTLASNSFTALLVTAVAAFTTTAIQKLSALEVRLPAYACNLTFSLMVPCSHMPTHGTTKPQKTIKIKNVTLFRFNANSLLRRNQPRRAVINSLTKIEQEFKKTNFLTI